MVPFGVLVSVFLVCRALGLWILPLAHWSVALRIALAAMFCLTASAHWGRRRPDLIRMMPDHFPNPAFWVTFTGIAEVLGAIGLLIPSTVPRASVGLCVLLIAVFPANVKAAREGLTLGGRPATPLGIRAALQLIFLAACMAVGLAHSTIPPSDTTDPAHRDVTECGRRMRSP